MQSSGVARRAGRRFLIAIVVLVALAAIGGTSPGHRRPGPTGTGPRGDGQVP